MKPLLSLLFFIALAMLAFAEDDPRAVAFSPVHIAKGNHIATDTSKSIVVYGARDDEGLYSVQGVGRRFSFKELETLLATFYRDFPKDAKTEAEGFAGLPVSRPNILYKSLSWAEVKNDGRDLVIKIAKEADVSLYLFTINPNYSVKKGKVPGIPDASTAVIDYYDGRLSSTARALWPVNRNPE